MADIKTRDVTRGTIKSLDRAASSMHRMKEQAIRSKSLEISGQKDSDSVSTDAQDVTGHYAGSIDVYAAEAGAQLAIRSRQKPLEIAEAVPDNEDRIRQAFREQGVKTIRDRQSRAKMTDVEVLGNTEEYRAGDRIRRAGACWRHGAGINCKCSCNVINDGQWNQLLNCKTDVEADSLATRLVGVPCKVIRNGGDAIPIGKLKQGDIISLYNIQAGNTLSQSTKSKIKVAIRYGGACFRCGDGFREVMNCDIIPPYRNDTNL